MKGSDLRVRPLRRSRPTSTYSDRMTRPAVRIALEFVLTVVVALILLGAVETAKQADFGAGFAEGVRLLFLFMDVGLGVWLLGIIIVAARTRGARPGVRMTLLLALIGALANLATVTVVGLVQQGKLPTIFIGYAIEAGICFLLAVLIVVPRVLSGADVKPPERIGNPT